MPKVKYCTIWLALACVIIFISQNLLPITNSLDLTSQAFTQPWRFVTAIFLHASLEHLIFNLFALVLFGLILESLIGSRKLVLVSLATGILANLISVFFYPSSLGASGAIMGIIGCLTLIRPMMFVFAFSIPMPMFLAAIIWAITDLFGVFMPSNVGNIAHLSGLALGLIFGLYFRIKHLGIQQARQARANYSRISIPEQDMRNWEDNYLR